MGRLRPALLSALLVCTSLGCASLGGRTATLRFTTPPLPASLCTREEHPIDSANLRFFVSFDGIPAHERVELVSMSPGCAQASSAEVPIKIRSDALLEFTFGVPAEANHGNPLLARAPLNNFDMHWTWQSGYKFLSLDLGSTGCFSESPVRPPASACKQPNRVLVRLKDPGTSTIALNVDFATFLQGLDPWSLENCVASYDGKAHCRTLLVPHPTKNDVSARPQAPRYKAEGRRRIRHTSRADNAVDGRLWARPPGGREAPGGVAPFGNIRHIAKGLGRAAGLVPRALREGAQMFRRIEVQASP